MTRWIKVSAILLMCSACAMAEPRVPDSDITAINSYARNLAENTEKAAEFAEITQPGRAWWEFYGDAELNRLITSALKDNPGFNQTQKRLEQAAASARIDFAALLPDATLSGSRSTSNGDNESPSTFSLRGAAGYELDLWGGNRADYKSGTLAAHAAAADVQAATVTLSASIVENWLRLLSLREEETLLRKQIETNAMILDLQHKRYESGAADALAVLQQSGVLENAKTQLPDILAQQEMTEHLTLVLAGRTPSDVLMIKRDTLPDILPVPQTGIPTDLLYARPDINAAWLRVSSADWAAESARVDRLPSFDISLDLTTTAGKFANLFDTWLLDLALNMVAPLFDGGLRAAEQARQTALADERFQAYRETVLNAILEVEDALTQNHHQSNKIDAIEKQLDVSRATLEQATISYGNGDADYISVLNALIDLQAQEIQLVRARRDLALQRVALYRSLGLNTWARKTESIDG